MGMKIFHYFWEKIKISICRPPTRFCSFVEMQIIKNELRLVCQQEIASNDKAENADSKLCSLDISLWISFSKSHPEIKKSLTQDKDRNHKMMFKIKLKDLCNNFLGNASMYGIKLCQLKQLKVWLSSTKWQSYVMKQLHSKGQKILKKIYVVLDSSKKRTLGQFYVLKIAPAFIFWKNPGRHNLLLRFTDL